MNEQFQKNLNQAPAFKTPEEEIAFLREELERHVEQDTEKHPSHEVARERAAHDILETYRDIPTAEVSHEDMRMAQHEVEGIQLRLNPETHDDTIQELYSLMLQKGIKNVLAVISRMKVPHIEDDFHRFLIQYLAASYEIPGLKPKTDLAKSLGLRMFEIILPTITSDGQEMEFKQIVALMEQFMAGMQSVASSSQNRDKNYFTLEISLENNSDEMALFVSVPESKSDLFEKQILGLFENVRVTEIYDDYNIFHYSGNTAAAVAKPSVNEMLELKTYESFEHDPMRVMVNTFSKLEKDEGAAVQFVIVPAGNKYIQDFGHALDNLKKGDKLKDALGSRGRGFVKNVAHEFKDIIVGSAQARKDGETQPELDQDAIDSVSKKLESSIVQTNMRIVVSAKTKERCDDILHDMESAFQQFTNTKGNGIAFTRVTRRDLEETIHQFIFRMYDDYHAFRFNLRELATLFHFPLGMTGSAQLKQEGNKTAPAPSGVPEEGIILGRNKYRHRETYVKMAPEDRVRHFYVIGQTGTGKSHLFKQMVVQDIKNGEGVCFIDPHGSDIEDIMQYIPPERIDDVIYFDPAHIDRPMGLNMLEYDRRYPEQKSFVINELMGIFNKLFDMKVGGGAMFEQYFRNSAGLVMEHPESGNTLLEISRVLGDKKFRDMKMQHCKNPIIKQFWVNAEKTTGDQGLENFIPYITSKFDVFISNEIMRPVVAQQQSSFNFREVMDNKKILLVNLSKGRLGEINANLIGLVLVGKILMAALSRVDSLDKDLPPFYLYIDEFQNVSTDSISQILSEARKYGLGLHMAHQFIAQLDDGIKDAVFGNVGSMATFRISTEDAQYLEKRFTPTFDADDIMKIPNRNAYLQMLGHGQPLTPFNIETLPLTAFVEKNPAGIADKIKELSYMKFGKPRAEVEADIISRYR